MQKCDCSHLLFLMFAEHEKRAGMRLQLLPDWLPRAAEGKSETVQRAEVKRFFFFGAR